MYIEDVDIVGLELLEGLADGDMQRLSAVTGSIAVNTILIASVGSIAGGVFRGHNHFIA